MIRKETQAEFYARKHREELLADVPRMITSSKEKTGAVGAALLRAAGAAS